MALTHQVRCVCGFGQPKLIIRATGPEFMLPGTQIEFKCGACKAVHVFSGEAGKTVHTHTPGKWR